MPTRADVQTAVDASKPRPVPNLSATTPSEVYTIETIIGERTFEDIPVKDWHKIVEEDGDIQTGSRFIAKRLLPALKRGDVKQVKILRYLLALLDFHAALKSGKSKTGKALPPKEILSKRMHSSPSLIDGIKRKFTKGPEMNRWQIDYLMTHIAALTLIVDNYETDMFELKEDLRLDLKQCVYR
jgi:DNA-directed RNA polymerase I subunit RPA49